MKKRILFLGIGNPILQDDAIGFIVLEKLKGKISSKLFDFKTEAVGGWQILDILKGYQTVIIVDSVYNNREIGKVNKMELEDFAQCIRPASPHDLNIFSAIELGEKMGYQMPERFIIFAVTIAPQYYFGDKISDDLKKKLDQIVDEIYNDEDIKKIIETPL